MRGYVIALGREIAVCYAQEMEDQNGAPPDESHFIRIGKVAVDFVRATPLTTMFDAFDRAEWGEEELIEIGRITQTHPLSYERRGVGSSDRHDCHVIRNHDGEIDVFLTTSRDRYIEEIVNLRRFAIGRSALFKMIEFSRCNEEVVNAI